MSSLGKFLILGAYFGGIGYAVGKSGIDKRIALAGKRGYTELVSYTKAIEPKPTLAIDMRKA